MCCIAFKHCG